MIGLGIDPGLATTGYGVVLNEGDTFKALDYGVIKTKKEDKPSFRLNFLSKEVEQLIKKHSPEFLAIENIYFFKNIQSAIPVSQAKGVVMVTAEKKSIDVFEFTPLEIKMTVTGYGKADKNQIKEMIKKTLNLKKKPHPSDAADALGVAICGIIKKKSPFFN